MIAANLLLWQSTSSLLLLNTTIRIKKGQRTPLSVPPLSVFEHALCQTDSIQDIVVQAHGRGRDREQKVQHIWIKKILLLMSIYIATNARICNFIALVISHDVTTSSSSACTCPEGIGVPLRSVIYDLLHRTETVAVDVQLQIN